MATRDSNDNGEGTVVWVGQTLQFQGALVDRVTRQPISLVGLDAAEDAIALTFKNGATRFVVNGFEVQGVEERNVVGYVFPSPRVAPELALTAHGHYRVQAHVKYANGDDVITDIGMFEVRRKI